MGKTSILRNLTGGSDLKLIYVNLQLLGSVTQGLSQVLLTIADDMAEQLEIPAPPDDAFLNFPLYKTYPNLPIKSETLMSNTFDASFNSCFYQGSRLALVHRRQFGRSSTYFFEVLCGI